MDKLKQLENVQSLSLLAKYTQARLAIGNAGAGIPTKAALEFNLAHANARDAVYSELDADCFSELLSDFKLPVLTIKSQATDRAQYLQRPDLGRKLHPDGWQMLEAHSTGADVAIIIADGLSAMAISQNAVALLQIFVPMLNAGNLRLAPITLVQQGRVAIADDIGEALKARLSIILIGERPGLSAADSMGVYITYQPKTGLTDEARNCISNIRPGGLSYQQAADKLYYLVTEAFRRGLSGVDLKDDALLLPPANLNSLSSSI